ncbi:MAG: carboxypeptidase-like regulatory domain-containing protein [Planctomycetota bacterium]
MPTAAATRRSAALLLIAALAAPAHGADADAHVKPKSSDIVLSPKGWLTGQVVDAQGKPMAGAEVLLYGADGKPVVAAANERGRFAYRGVAGGVYYLQSGNDVRIARVWPSGVAPPRAQSGVLLVSKPDTVRGQYGPPRGLNAAAKRLKKTMTNPLAVSAMIGTAVAIPVAVHNSDDGS